eukprot:gnl/TRDRNA2_/TRDRNA2_188560_c0_seq1.p1 gnl/TRDRNA2_/TRDRNA2_188560_c0~~gnl/TRDRNA2_/TRDRNA2_188560_c0_seq1.p1  ORF type:complete len:207 (-),score=47.85 gnl/TRDRNA2_/TRDRNA2_188560_c0_seq1:100-720(-)
MNMRVLGFIALLAASATPGALGSLRVSRVSNSNATMDMCVAGFAGHSPEEQCQSLVDFIHFSGANKVAVEKRKKSNKTASIAARVNRTLAKKTSIAAKVNDTLTKVGSGETTPAECLSSCEEHWEMKTVQEEEHDIKKPSQKIYDQDGTLVNPFCCATVYDRLQYYEDTNTRCQYQSTCWKSLKYFLPKYLKHYNGLADECDVKCK